MLQSVAVCCRVLQCVAACCSVLQCVAAYASVLPCVAVCRMAAALGAEYCSALQPTFSNCNWQLLVAADSTYGIAAESIYGCT